MRLTDQQRELYGTVYLRSYTEDVYVGPDIKSKCLSQMVDPKLNSMVHLEPIPNTDTRVLLALLDDIELMSEACKDMITLSYAIGECVKGPAGKVAVKWYPL